MWSNFEQRMQQRMKSEHIVGAAVAVMRKGIVVYQQGFGVGNLYTKQPVMSHTVFGTASITKSFTALSILKLEDEGFLSTDDPVTTYIPGFRLQGVENMEEVKIHHLLTHTTGLAPVERDENRNMFVEQKQFLMGGKHQILGRPGEYFSYSNDMFSLLGEIIQKVSGKLYRRYITEEILSPLEMNRSTMSVEELAKFNQVSTPYVYNKIHDNHEEQKWPTLGVYEVGGGLRSTTLDLLEYGELFLNRGIIGAHSIISPKTIKKMSEPYIHLGQNHFYGYGLKVTPNYQGRTLIEHGGSQPGVSSNFGYIPEEDLVVVVLCNVSNVSVGEIWLEAVNSALGLPIDEKDDVIPHRAIPKEEIVPLLGVYSSKEGNRLEVTFHNEQLMLQINGEWFEANANDRTTIVLKESQRPIIFHFKDGKSWAAFFGMRMLLKEE